MGTVSLVNASFDSNGSVRESETHTGHWAWKVPDGGAFRYVPLLGDVRFHDVSFSYDGKKEVLHDISLYAKPGQKIALVGSTGAPASLLTVNLNLVK